MAQHGRFDTQLKTVLIFCQVYIYSRIMAGVKKSEKTVYYNTKFDKSTALCLIIGNNAVATRNNTKKIKVNSKSYLNERTYSYNQIPCPIKIWRKAMKNGKILHHTIFKNDIWLISALEYEGSHNIKLCVTT